MMSEREYADHVSLLTTFKATAATSAIAQAQPLAGIAAAGLARSGQADPVPGPRYPRNSLGRQ
jgi:hypothetical protein